MTYERLLTSKRTFIQPSLKKATFLSLVSSVLVRCLLAFYHLGPPSLYDSLFLGPPSDPPQHIPIHFNAAELCFLHIQ